MSENKLSVREIQESDIDLIAQYWLGSDKVFLEGMGVDTTKLPSRQEWRQMLSEQLSQPYDQKKSYCIIWLVNNIPVGHSNVNKIIFGKEAYMHLHIWNSAVRQKGLGVQLIRKSLPYFFKNLQLAKLYCEPYALNPAPNKTLKKAGFTLVKEYITTPGWINFEQPVKLWELDYKSF